MKKAVKSTVSLLLAFIFIFSLAACTQDKVDAEGLWKDADYVQDTSFGDGAKTVKVEVEVEERSVLFTVKTDKATVGEALFEHGLIAGEEGQYGLYLKVVNGITADYDVDQSYWAFYINGEYAMTGVDGTPIDENATYKLAYTK